MRWAYDKSTTFRPRCLTLEHQRLKERSLQKQFAIFVLTFALCAASCKTVSGMCREAETCCFEDLVTRVFELEGGGYEEGYEEEGRWEVAIRYTTPSWMRTCLRSVKYSGSKATATATIIKNILRETYAFSDLVRDTHDTDSFVSGRYAGNFNVHHLRVPISASVDKVLQDSKLEGGHHHSAYDFHYGVAEIFHSLNDAHTSYETPFGDFALHRAVTLWPQLESNNKQVFVLKSLLDDFSAEVAGIYRDVHGVEMPDISLYKGQVVTHVNGVPAAEYMQQRADAFGGIKSQGGRLNNLLNMESSYGGDIEPLGDHPPPEVDEEVFRFEDGTEVTWKLTISYEGGAEGSADLEESSGASDAYDAFSRLFQKVADNYSLLWGEPCTGCVPAKVSRRSSSGPAHKLEKLTHWKSLVLEVAPALAELISGRASSPNSKHNDTDDNDNAHVSRGLNQYDSGQDGADHYGSADMYSSGSHYGSYENYYDEADFTDLEARELTDDVTQVAVFKAGYSGDEAEPFIGVYHMRNAGAIVIKLNTFEGEAGAFSSDNGGFLKSLIMTFQEADAYAQENGVEQLILDMSFNGGGDPTAIFVLLRLVQNGWTKIEDLCDVANIKISDLGEFFYEAGDLSALKSLLGDIEDATSSELDEAIESIQSIFDAIKEMIEAVAEELGLAAEGLMPMYGDILSVEVAPQSLTVNKKRALLEQLIENITKFTQAVWPELSGDGKYSIRTGEAFEGTAWFDEGRQATVRGGANVNYTQFFYAFCPEAMEFFASITGNPNTVVHTFKKAVLLTDGTCGSACSTFATRLMLSGSVRSVSYGGYAGDASMDSSAFGGGNVVSWQSHAIGTVTAFFINLLLGHAPRPIYDMDITDVPIPFPSSASARFTVDCSYEPYLGPRSLPREFYVIPADVHVAMWIEDPGTLPYVGTDGQAMHTDILRAWRRAAEEFSRAPLLSDWLKKDWDYASPVDPSPTNTPSLSDPSLNEGKGIVVNFKITFQKMDVSEITDTLRSHIRAQMASAAGVSLPYVLIVSETPGSAIWEMDVIFPGENTGAAESFVSVLQTNVTSILAEDGIASDYGVAQTAASVELFYVQSIAGYLEQNQKNGAASCANSGGILASILAGLALFLATR